MNYIVYCLDHDGMVDTRLAHYDAHKSYLATSPVKTLISGPLVADDDKTMIGSFFLYESESIEAVRNFANEDPFNKVGIWKTMDVRPFLERVDNR